MYEHELRVAIEAVRKASRLCRVVQAELTSAETLAKKDRSPVTVADFGAQAIVGLEMAREFPDDPIVGEENAGHLRTDEGAAIRKQVVGRVQAVMGDVSDDTVLDAIDRGAHGGGNEGRHWTLDPIDGTKGFLRGEQYAVALALIERGKVVLGVLGCPNLPVDMDSDDAGTGCLFHGVVGQGAKMCGLDAGEETAVAVTSIDDPAHASFCESVESGHSSHSDSARIADELGVKAEPFRIDSQCKYAAVARGNASIYLRLPTRADYEEKIWDHAAGVAVVTEAGGKVTDVDGRPLDFSIGRTLRDNKGVIVTNGLLHDRTIAAVKKVLGR